LAARLTPLETSTKEQVKRQRAKGQSEKTKDRRPASSSFPFGGAFDATSDIRERTSQKTMGERQK
jgi:hypothetical protein